MTSEMISMNLGKEDEMTSMNQGTVFISVKEEDM